ncbi:c-type cytochrome [candidate division KSB1 bacterium]|nr:c-type cytochrome [candidate division KSB1 bacterium]
MKWIVRLLITVVAVIAVAAGYIYWASSAVLNKDYSHIAKGQPIYAPGDSAALVWGTHLAKSIAMCEECHGEGMTGFTLVDDPMFGRLATPNVTRGGKGSEVPASFDIADFERLIRHGVTPKNRGVILMPSFHYCYISDEDIAALWTWYTSLKPVDKEVEGPRYGPIARMLIAQDKFTKLSPEMVNHTAKRPAKPVAGESWEYGEYLAHVGCTGCHGMDLSGGPIEGGPPEWPLAANLTRGGIGATYTEADFFRALREGIRPGGKPLSAVMPFKRTTNLTDSEIRALWLYVQHVPAKPVGSFVWKDEQRP